MDDIRVRELPKKSGISLKDQVVLEDMDGTKTAELAEIVTLLKKNLYLNTVEDMKNASFKEGDVVTTLGYRSINDGGGATYIIKYSPVDLEDGMLIHYLHTSDTLRAHLVYGDTLNILQCGAFGDGISDDYICIANAMTLGIPLYFPKRAYLMSRSLELDPDTYLDFNMSTIICNNSSAFQIGNTKEGYNISINNVVIKALYGIDIYANAHDISINNVHIKKNKANVNKGISIYGARDISISDCVIGSSKDKVLKGISLSVGTKGSTTVGCKNISVNNVTIVASDCGVETTSTVRDGAITITDTTIKGYESDRAKVNTVGVYISSVGEGISISDCIFNNLHTGVKVGGIIDIICSISDIVCDDVCIMYSILSDAARVYLSGIQRFTGSSLSGNDYIFDRMTGKLYLNSHIEAVSTKSDTKIQQAKTSLSGEVVDSIYPIAKNKITLTSSSQMNSNIANPVNGYENVAVDLNYGGNITSIPFPSLNGQLVALYSSAGARLKHGGHILIGSDVTLNAFTPVIVKNITGYWYRVQ